jgi:aryl-alcohol dehydrogenase-like predicted oxidoreductase
MNRSQFLRLAGRAASLGVAAPLAGSPALALAAEGAVLRRPIPSSGEQIPVIGVGTAVVYEIEPTDSKFPALLESIRAFLSNGGSLIDTSPTYGRAEKNLGEIFKRLDPALRKNAFIATKISTSGEKNGMEQYSNSLRDMGIDRIDLLQVHNIRDTATHLRTIRRLRDEGKVRYVGITTSFDNSYREFESIMQKERLDFIQIDYALDNRNAEERILPLARDRGMAVLVNLPFGRGRLLSRARGRPLPEWAHEIDAANWAQVFLKWILGNPAVTVVIPGTDRPEFAIDNLNAARGRLPDAKLREVILRDWER